MMRNENETWNYNQWQFYECRVELGETVLITLTYEGDLDLDLRLYWGRDNFYFRGIDLTYYPISNLEPSDNSQLRTTSTTDLGLEEELTISNEIWTNERDQMAYILVFVYDGVGESEYTLSADHTITELNDSEVSPSENFLLIFLLYFLAAVGVVVISLLISKRVKKYVRLSPEEKVARKEAKKAKKEEKKKPEEETIPGKRRIK